MGQARYHKRIPSTPSYCELSDILSSGQENPRSRRSTSSFIDLSIFTGALVDPDTAALAYLKPQGNSLHFRMQKAKNCMNQIFSLLVFKFVIVV
ncbi:hypothetical protein SLA2020_082290 [Shorea laevis]